MSNGKDDKPTPATPAAPARSATVTVSVPPGAAVIRKIKPPAGVHSVVGYMEPGWLTTLHLPIASTLTDGQDAEFEPATQEDRAKIKMYRKEQATKATR